MAVIDLDEGAAKLTAKLAGEGLAVAADVSDSAQVDAALATVEAELGPLDIWVNNAGISGGAHSDRVNPRAEEQLAQLTAGEEVTTALEATAGMSDEEWRQMLSVHLDGTFYGTRAAARVDGPPRQRHDRQHGLDLRDRGLHRPPPLLGGQGRHPRLHPHRRQRADPAGHPRQRDRPRLRRHPARLAAPSPSR